MEDKEFKFPTSQAEWDEMKKCLRTEITDEAADAIVGGNDDPTMKGKNNPAQPWTCPGCGATVMVKQFQDKAKHMVKCPANPYK